MPPVSLKQRKAMRAAAAGKSTIGIPKKVGAEFSKADPGGKLPEKKMQASTKKRDAPNVGAGNRMDFKGTNKGYAGATKDRNTASMNRERAVKASGEKAPGAVDRSAHWKGNPGFPSSPEAGNSPPPSTLQSREIPERGGFGVGSPNPKLTEPVVMNEPARMFGPVTPKRDGKLRLSGNPGAHRLGRR